MNYLFKVANTNEEFEQIHRLNHEIFVEELQQHQLKSNRNNKRIDKFHDENTYYIAIYDNRIVGMVCLRDQRPFSLEDRINIDIHSPYSFDRPCELRLLAVKKEHRNGKVFRGLWTLLMRGFEKGRYDVAFSSGVVQNLGLYEKIGFERFSEPVQSGKTDLQPIVACRENFLRFKGNVEPLVDKQVNFLPGPVPLTNRHKTFLQGDIYSHRSDLFIETHFFCQQALRELTNSAHVEILTGTGTLANEAIGYELKKIGSKGLILVNGEFGRRLVQIATRLALDFSILELKDGFSFTGETLSFVREEDIDWIWAVHHETSTGIITDLDLLKSFSLKIGAKLCLDCVSSIGLVPLNFQDIYLASGVSGKALGGLTGLSFVFYRQPIQEHPTVKPPFYLDLYQYEKRVGVPFSSSSMLYDSLKFVLSISAEKREGRILENYIVLRDAAWKANLKIISQEEGGVLTIELDEDLNSKVIGSEMVEAGFNVHYVQEYLARNRWIQIAPFGHYEVGDLKKVICYLALLIRYKKQEVLT
ncbi:GNAT family N-acetyltransferase [Shouchella sp. 1P09AA]|uniref:GNAT family N-acetyltransferase n=1 Tax=Bacillaceae TaxID=186817 RepID=UPI000C07F81E|nr:GNAT family N-acetyltransferase [Bacillus sp. Marseille-P3800]